MSEIKEQLLAAAGWNLDALAIALAAFRSAPYEMTPANTAGGNVR
jgi:hypothetical protein